MTIKLKTLVEICISFKIKKGKWILFKFEDWFVVGSMKAVSKKYFLGGNTSLPKIGNGHSHPQSKSWEWESGIPVSHSCSWKLRMQFLIPVPFSGMVLWGRRWESDRKLSTKDCYQRLTLIMYCNTFSESTLLWKTQNNILNKIWDSICPLSQFSTYSPDSVNS